MCADAQGVSGNESHLRRNFGGDHRKRTQPAADRRFEHNGRRPSPDGIELVTEGIFTLSRAATYLEKGDHAKLDPAQQLVELMRRHDIIEFVVGTRINEAHQDPNLPIDLELRRNIIRRLETVLRDRYMKEVRITFV